MEIFKTKLEDILKFPFENKDWFSKFGIYTLISLISTIIIIAAISLIFVSFVLILESIASLNFAFTMIIATIFAIFFALFFTLNIYLQGYIIEMIKNIKEKKQIVIPEHKNISVKLKYGIAQFLLGVGPMTISFLMLGFSIAMIAVGANNAVTILIIFGVLMVLIATIFSIIMGIFVLPSMLYIYLDTGSISKAYSLTKIYKIIKNSWKYFLIIYALNLIGFTMISTVGQIPGIGFLILIVGTVYVVFVVAFVTGKVFTQLDKLKVLK